MARATDDELARQFQAGLHVDDLSGYAAGAAGVVAALSTTDGGASSFHLGNRFPLFIPAGGDFTHFRALAQA